MSEKIIFGLYGRYYDVLKKLSSFPILEFPTVKNVFEKNESLVQMGYRDMKLVGFAGTLVEFLCWIDMIFLVNNLKKNIGEENTMVDWALAILDNYEKYVDDTRNFLRFFEHSTELYNYFNAAIKGLLIPESLTKSDWGDTKSFKKNLVAVCVISSFIELLLYEETFGEKREDYDEVLDFVKGIATIKVK